MDAYRDHADIVVPECRDAEGPSTSGRRVSVDELFAGDSEMLCCAGRGYKMLTCGRDGTSMGIGRWLWRAHLTCVCGLMVWSGAP